MSKFDQDTTNKLYVAGVSWETTNDGLFNFFARFGTVVSATIQRDHSTGRSRGFGFVTFADRASCEKVLAEQNLSLDGRKMEIKYAVPKGQVSYEDSRYPATTPTGRPKKLYIAGISVGVSEDDLKEHFSAFGKVVECYIQKDRNTGESRGFAFLTYESADSVDKVMAKPSQKIGDKCIVDVKIARPKGEPAPSIGFGSSFGGGPSSWSGGYGYGGAAPGYSSTGYSSGGWGVDTSLGSSRVADGYGSTGLGSSGLSRDYSYAQGGYDQYGYGTGGAGGYGDPSGLSGYNQWSGASTDDTKRTTGYEGYGTGLTSTPSSGASSYDPTTGQYSYGATPTTGGYDPTSSQYTYGALRRTTPTTLTTPTTTGSVE